MSVIKGIPVIVWVKRQTGTDAFNAPIYEYDKDVVENVLIHPVSSYDDVRENGDVNSDVIRYQIAMPKGDTHELRNTFVEFFGKVWHTVGEPIEGIEANIPLDWNRKILVEYHE